MSVENNRTMWDDLTNRICLFGQEHFGIYHHEIALSDEKLEAATKLFWDHYFDSEVEL